MPVNLIQYSGTIRVTAKNVFVRIYPTSFLTNCFQNLLGLLRMNSIIVSLLFFGVILKHMKAKVKKIQILLSWALHSVAVILLIYHIWLYRLIIKVSGNIALNPGPKQKHNQNLSICQWNLNSIPSYNFQKLELFQSNISSNKVDQCVLGLVLGSNHFFTAFEQYLFFKVAINEFSWL